MTGSASSATALPPRAGASLKPAHVETILAQRPDIGWFEVHAENYMGAGGRPHEHLAAIAGRWPLSIHGVGLSIGGEEPPDREHLARLRALVERYEPAVFSEHLAWSRHGGTCFNDLLPLPYNGHTLDRVTAHVEQVQEALGRQILLENPSTYVVFESSTMDEIAFLREVARRSGCGLLLDVNNVYVSSVNNGFDARAYLADFPLSAVGEIHLAGHASETDDEGRPLLIDTHDRRVDAAVWALYDELLDRTGPLATLIEWDKSLPEWPVLFEEARRIDDRLHGGMRYERTG